MRLAQATSGYGRPQPSTSRRPSGSWVRTGPRWGRRRAGCARDGCCTSGRASGSDSRRSRRDPLAGESADAVPRSERPSASPVPRVGAECRCYGLHGSGGVLESAVQYVADGPLAVASGLGELPDRRLASRLPQVTHRLGEGLERGRIARRQDGPGDIGEPSNSVLIVRGVRRTEGPRVAAAPDHAVRLGEPAGPTSAAAPRLGARLAPALLALVRAGGDGALRRGGPTRRAAGVGRGGAAATGES